MQPDELSSRSDAASLGFREATFTSPNPNVTTQLVFCLPSGSRVDFDFASCVTVLDVKLQLAAALGACPRTVGLLAEGRILRATDSVDSLAGLNVVHVVLSPNPPVVIVAEKGSARVLCREGADGVSSIGSWAEPRSVCLDHDRNILVADAKNSQIYRCNPVSGEQEVVASSFRNSNGEILPLARPYCIVVDKRGNMFVAEHSGHRITRWCPGSEHGEIVAGGLGRGTDLNQLHYPTGIAVDDDGAIFVAEYGNNRVSRWLPGAMQGEIVAGGNGSGGRPDQLNGPWGVCLDEEGALYVSEVNNHRVTRWLPGAKTGKVVAGGNGSGAAVQQLAGPTGMCLAGDGAIYVAENHNGRITRWVLGRAGGEVVMGGVGSTGNQLDNPVSVFVG